MLTQAEHDAAHCFTAHRILVEHAAFLAGRTLRSRPRESDLLRLGAGCVNVASQRALTANDPRPALRAWSECEPGERQIRAATYRLLMLGQIAAEQYDMIFHVATRARQARRDEQLRLRRELRELCGL
jgi:hypothetical protein